jgi:hypothetical protein
MGGGYGEVDACAGRSKNIADAQRGGDIDDDIHAAQRTSDPVSISSKSTASNADSCQGEPRASRPGRWARMLSGQ